MKAADIKCPHKGCGNGLAGIEPSHDFTPGLHTEIKADSVYCAAGHRTVVSSIRKRGQVRFHVEAMGETGR